MAQLFGITNCEASLESFYRTGLMDHCSSIEKHAMYLHYALKQLSRQHGHTYIKRSRLDRESLYVRATYLQSSNTQDGAVPTTADWDRALDFLEDWHVIVRENDGIDVYLHRYWNAEKKIAEAVRTLRMRHKVEPWTFEIDAEKYVHVFLCKRVRKTC